MKLPSRLTKNFSAQIFSQAVTLGVQFGSVPILILAWGIERYGVWVLLTALPAYLNFSDFGFTFIAKNDMSIRVSAGDRAGAMETFQSILGLLAIAGCVLAVAAAVLLTVAPIGDWFNLGSETLAQARGVLGTQTVSVIAYQFFLLLSAGVRCEGRPATETMFAASARLFEAAAIAIAALCGAGLAGAALAGMSSRLLSLVLLAVWVRRNTPWLKIGFVHATRSRLKEMAGPSLTYMLVPVSNALMIQGPLVVLGAVATPATVALFSVTRTVARLGTSGSNMLSFALQPEYSFAFGRRDHHRYNQLLKIHAALTIAGLLAYGLCVIFLGELGVRLISHGQLNFSTALLWTLGLATAFEMVWTGLFTPLSAINAHKVVSATLAAALVVASLIVIPVASVINIAIALVVVHLVMTAVATWRLAAHRWPEPHPATVSTAAPETA